MGSFKDWTDQEFKAYLLIYAAESNFEYHVEEKKLIKSKFESSIIEKIKSEMGNLNDYQRSQIIVDYLKLKNYSQEELDEMLAEIKELYFSDGSFDKYQQSVYIMLQKLMKS